MEHDYDDERATPEPANLDAIQQRIQAQRRSLSPSTFPESVFRDLRKQNARITSEATVMNVIMPFIQGHHPEICHEADVVFTNIDSMTNDLTVRPKPDIYDGARRNQIHSRIRQELGQFVIVTKNDGNSILPNFFVEVKAPKGSSDVVQWQACYNGANGPVPRTEFNPMVHLSRSMTRTPTRYRQHIKVSS